MNERDGYPAGVPCWIDSVHDDPEAAAAFYGDLFGWEMSDQMPADAPGHYFMASLRGRTIAGVGSRPEAMPAGARWSSYVWVDDADQTAQLAADAGGSVLMGPFDVFDAGRMAMIADPEGAVIGAWQARAHRGAQLVNEPGTWNFSDLSARDLKGALAFYGAVFGWVGGEPDPDSGNVLLRRPGYGDYLADLDPDMRRRMSELNESAGDLAAPDGFEDAVAWIAPVEDAETAPGWSVSFSVDDADAVAERAETLGGTVLMPPTDLPWVRMTVLRDPQGAVFTATKFVPPGS